MDIKLYRYVRPFLQGTRKGLLLRLEKSGQLGWGEIAPLPGFSKENLCQAQSELHQALPRLLQNPDLSAYSPSVQFGISSALADLATPIQLPPIPVNALIHAENLDHFNPASYRAVKIKVGHLSAKEAATHVQANRYKLESLKVRIDANRSWSLEDALFFAEKCTLPHLEYFEEPLKNSSELKAFPYPLAFDESFREGATLLSQVRAVVFKPTLQSWTPACAQKGVDFILSSSYESEVGLMQIAKLAVREKLPLHPMGLDTYRLFKDTLFEEGLEVINGKLHFPKQWNLKPGSADACFRMSL